jgi:hypothetical protein
MTYHQPAADLLLRCLSVTGPPSSVLRQPSAVWDEVRDMAADHGLVPLLFKRLKQNGVRASVPPTVWHRLRLAYLASAGGSTRLYRELRTLLRRLRSDGIPVMVLKGAYLAEVVYEDVTLRPMGDVDLMVPRADLPGAHAAALSMGRVGQKPEDAESRLAGSGRPWLTPVVCIDLCWTFDVPGGRSRLDTAGLWDRARPATIAGVDVLALSPEDLLLHLCLHAAHRHGLGFGLLPFCDIAETTRRFRGDIDWVQVVERAREWEAVRYVGLMLFLARSMLNAGVPDDVLDKLVPGGIDQRILTVARESVLGQGGYIQRLPFFGRLGAKSIGEKARLSWERVFLSREEMAATYPASRNTRHLYFYYTLRLRDVVGSALSHTFERGRLMMRGRGHDRNAALVNWLKED